MRGILRALGLFAAVTLPSVSAFAEEAVATAASGGFGVASAAALGLAIAALGGALGQGKICAAAMEGIARNPNAQDKMLSLIHI